MKSAVLFVLVLFASAAQAQSLIPESRIKLVDGHLANWEARWSPAAESALTVWGSETGWISAALRWGPVLVGPMRSVREESTPWDFLPDPHADPGVWGAVVGSGQPVSCWWVQTPEAVVAGAQGAWKVPGLLAAAGFQVDLGHASREIRGSLSVGETAGKLSFWYDDGRAGARLESSHGSRGWSASAQWDFVGDPWEWKARIIADELSFGVDAQIRETRLGGRVFGRWSGRNNLLEVALFQSLSDGPGMTTQFTIDTGNVSVNGMGTCTFSGTDWNVEVGLGWRSIKTRWSATVGTSSGPADQDLPPGVVRVTCQTDDGSWKADLELKAPQRAAQWFGAGNQVTLELSHGF